MKNKTQQRLLHRKAKHATKRFGNYSEPVRMAVSVHAKLGQGWWSARSMAHGCAIERLREQK